MGTCVKTSLSGAVVGFVIFLIGSYLLDLPEIHHGKVPQQNFTAMILATLTGAAGGMIVGYKYGGLPVSFPAKVFLFGILSSLILVNLCLFVIRLQVDEKRFANFQHVALLFATPILFVGWSIVAIAVAVRRRGTKRK